MSTVFDLEYWQEYAEERAAMYEFEANFPRHSAEFLAIRDVREQIHAKTGRWVNITALAARIGKLTTVIERKLTPSAK